MTTSELRELLTILREFGVTSYSQKDTCIELFHPGATEQVETDHVESFDDEPVTASEPERRQDGLTEDEQLLLYGKVLP